MAEEGTAGSPRLAAATRNSKTCRALTGRTRRITLERMEVRFKPETESRLAKLAAKSGRPTDELVEDAMAGYLAEAAELREMLDSRYDDIKSGRVKPMDGEEAFARLRRKSKSRRRS